jgi:hypothetical protein
LVSPRSGVDGTPALFTNGHRFDGAPTLENQNETLRALL